MGTRRTFTGTTFTTLGLAALLALAGCAGAAPEEGESSPVAAPPNTTEPPSESESPSQEPSAAPSGTPSETGTGEGPAFETELVIEGIGVPREVVPVGEGVLLVSDQTGVVHVVENGKRRDEPFLDLREQIRLPDKSQLEHGLVGFALAPDFAETGHVWTTTTEGPVEGAGLPSDTRQINFLRRWTADPDTLTVDPGSAEEILMLPTPSISHPAGEIVFDDKGFLYTSLGSDATSGHAQDPTSLAGAVVRIDPSGSDGDKPYAIPPDNPFADGKEGLPEVYSYGYRNPWRLSWDAEHGLLVGEAMFRDKPQQMAQPKPGDNAGYPEVKEACWGESGVSEACRETSAGTPIAPPVLEYPFTVGEILTGVVPVPEGAGDGVAGRVLVSDWKGSLLVAEPGEAPWSYVEADLGDILSSQYLWDLDVTDDGSVYALVAATSMNDDGGAVYRIKSGG